MDSTIERERRFAAEQLALAQRHHGERAEENARLKAAQLKALEAEELARTAARQAAAETELKASLKLQFLKSPAATEADFNKSYPQLREEHLRREATSAPERERQALAASGDYGF